MYHFVAEPTAELRLSDNVLIANQTTQYLKSFQLDAVRFLHDRLSKQEFCIFNDESGLGKCSSIVALLSGLGTSKKTLVVLQNDDHLLAGWQFHLGVLTDLPVCVLKDVKDSTESAHSVYLSKWSILRSIGDLSKLKFDYIIVDHRGYTLNNSFCSSMLLKQYEGKVNIVISSVDITSDVKLLYNVLRLGGCLEHQYKSFPAFERRFHLPDVKEVLSKRVDLEEYYKQRGVLGEFIKDYRLRRYRHQFESYLPLVSAEQYKLNLSLWLGENNSNSTISQTTIESSAEALSTGSTDQIFECLRNMKRECESSQHEEIDKISDCSDEVAAMEPLQMSESELEDASKDQNEENLVATSMSTGDVVTISSDDCEIVTPPSTQPTTSPAARRKRRYTKRLHQEAVNADLTESETEESEPSTSYRKSLNVSLCRKTPEQPKAPQQKKKTPIDQQQKKPSPKLVTPKQEPPVTPRSEPKTRRSCLRDKNSDEVEVRQTRGMQRQTRSAESRIQSKYMLPRKGLEYEKKSPAKGKRGKEAQQTPKSSKRKREEDNVKEEATSTPIVEDEPPPKKRGRPRKYPKPDELGPPKKVENTKKIATPELLSSGSVASDYSYLQCGQKLPDNLTELGAFHDFRVPDVPATPLMLPSLNLNFFSDSEVIIVPSSLPKAEVVVINSSNEECQQPTTQSRRTRALKRKGFAKEQSQPSASTSNFGLLLAEQRARGNKSPDVFSNCSDYSQITLAQPVPPASPFEGFKIFGSEVKQQHQVKTQQSKRERSCLDILENMFEPHKTTTNTSGINLLPMLPSPKKQQRRFTLLDEDIFEITNNGEFGSRLRLNSTGNVSPVPQPQPTQPQQQQLQQRNKITKYLIGSGCTPEDAGQRIQALSPAQRKSPKSIKSTQSTKLTRWFGTADAAGSQSAPSTPQGSVDNAAAARAARSGGPSKRKQLNLFK
ncbi:hypothetical protein KR044_013314 [Drosophila immigrans]|nr:hypothetical protein KR044_013314 [Drosophila immigrans]